MRWHSAFGIVGALVIAVGSGACNILEVSDPARFDEEDLKENLLALGNSAEGNVHKWMDWYVVWQELLSDVLIYQGPIEYQEQYGLIDQGRVEFNTYPVARTPRNYAYGAYNFPDGMAESRWLAEKAWGIAASAYEEGDSVDAHLEFESSFLAAQIKLGWAFSNMYLGLFSCEGVLGSPDDEGGAPMYLDIQIYDSTISVFTHVIEIMERIPPLVIEEMNSDYLEAARAGRAIMRTLAGDYDGAVADASAVSDGFSYDALHGSQFSAWNQMYELGSRQRIISLHPWIYDTMPGSGCANDKWTGLPDCRLDVNFLGPTFFQDETSWIPAKYSNSTSSIPMVSSKHARLIEAEAMVMSGDYEGAMSVLNALRGGASLPGLPVPQGEYEMTRVLIHERYAELFAEGWRQVDFHRFGVTRDMFDELGDAAKGSAGRPTKFPGSAREAWLNPMVEDNAALRCHPNA